MAKRSVVLWTVILLAMYALRTFAATDPFVDKLEKSIVQVDTTEGRCTGFIINSHYGDKGDKDLILTAGHCQDKEITADGQPATVKAKFEREDLLVLEADDTGRPALKLAKADPVIQQRVIAIGFGYGLEKPLFRHSEVSQVEMRLPELEGAYVVVDAGFVSGQSGGPVINTDGEVVMLVQRGNTYIGLGVGAETIRKKTGKFWEKPEPGK